MYILKQVKYAILRFDKYPELLKTNLAKVIFYALFFIFLSNFTYTSFPFITSYTESKGFDNFVKNYIPDFTTKDNKLVFDEYSKVDTPLDVTFIFDPNEKNNYITNEDKKYVDNIILKVTPTHIISSHLNINIKISDMIKIFNISEKSDLANLKLFIYISIGITFIFFIISFIISDIFRLIISALFISPIARFYNLKSSFLEIFKLTVYVNTLPFILKLILMPMPIFIYIGFILLCLHFIFKSIQENIKTTQINTY
ncbi:DUF1189 family protein [uncultured Tyzzerella sp.]|uniref:DUF1189 family protein n=1 Tax=uncultured Tyzzerella sp. TaxID=2321398 RepID=UPI002943969A|nr:DUF1189 family protein [uncultured Tyzzerella sp.]